jgi:hypothetical protein
MERSLIVGRVRECQATTPDACICTRDSFEANNPLILQFKFAGIKMVVCTAHATELRAVLTQKYVKYECEYLGAGELDVQHRF